MIDWSAAFADVLIVQRLIVLVLAVYVVAWAAPFTARMMIGRWSVRHVYRSALFFFSAGAGLFQLLALLDSANDATRFMFLLLILIALILSCWVKRLAPRYDAMLLTVDHIGEAMALLDLAAVDPIAAERIAVECRRLTAERMMRHG